MTRSTRLAAGGVSVVAVVVGLALIAAAQPRKSPPQVPPVNPAAPRPEQWKNVEAAVNQGLPKTAIEHLEPIIAAALKEKAYPEAVRAMARKVSLEGVIQGNKPEEKVTRWEAAMATAPAEMRPVMQAVLAHWYWHYFQQNRWRFVQRTQTAEAPGKDFTTWDLHRLFAEIDRHFTAALAARDQLKAVQTATYGALLEPGALPDAYRPTLFDFLAFEALDFYTSPEQAGAKVQDAFEVAADGPALAARGEFLRWQPKTDDAASRTLRAVKLYQELLTFHAADADPAARLDADLHRLQWAYNAAVGDGKFDRYVAELKALAGANAGHPLSARARFLWATALDGQDRKAEARAVADAGRAAFPDSPGGRLCDNLVRQIEAKESALATERVWAEPLPAVRVTYRNVGKVYFRLVKADFEARLKRPRWRPESVGTEEERRALLRSKPAAEFSHDLPPTPDYRTRVEDVPAPKGVAPGFYFLLSSHDPAFGEQDNVIHVTDVWVSSLAVVTRQDTQRAKLGGLVVRADSGEPVAGADVRVWTRDNRTGVWHPGDSTRSDDNGLFDAPTKPDQTHLLLVKHDGQALATASDHTLYGGGGGGGEQTVFFTDRSIYRPGQTVHFKGIAVRADHDSDTYATVPNRPLTVVFRDANRTEIARLPVRTNDFGSFSGSVTAPRDRLTGEMTLSVDGPAHGTTAFRVEEYKRPKFVVTLDSPAEPAKLLAGVKVPGRAVSYTGVPIGGATVRFRVTREVRYPAWFHAYCWWRPVPHSPAQEIAHGFAVTEADGSFVTTFVAAPDRSVPEADDPSFRYVVRADVTDTTGETRSAERSVEVGYTALRATVGVPGWLAAGQEATLTVSTTNLDGVGQPAKGTLKLYALKQPAAVARRDILGGPPRPRRANGARPAAANAPPPADPSKPASWEEAEVVHEAAFETDKAGTAKVAVKLPAGLFRAVLATADPFGKPVTAKQQVRVLDPAADRLNIKVPNVVAAPKWSLQPGDLFTALWGTGYETGRAFVEVEHRGRVLQGFWTEPGKTQALVREQVTEGMRGGFTLRVTQVRENRAYVESRHVDVPWTNKQLTVKWERFVNKLEPGKKETFTAVITGPDARKAVAEMVAAVYDQSLDAFQPHRWPAGFGVFRQDHAALHSQFENLPRHLQHWWGRWHPSLHNVQWTYRHFPHDVTANLWGYEYQMAGGGMGRDRMAKFADGFMAAPAAAAPRNEDPGLESTAKASFGMMRRKAKQNTSLKDEADVKSGNGGPDDGPGGRPDPGKVEARKNLQETAFFFPHLVSDADGVVRMEFTMPEALTKWKFLGFAHDTDLRAGGLTDELVTAKELMAEPNPPRFLREGDALDFTVKLSNTADKPQAGTVRLTLADARTEQPVDDAFGNTAPDQAFDLKPGESKTFAWRLTVPDGAGPVVYKAVAASDRLSDGEQAVLPVLSTRVLVTESLPLPIRGPGTKTFEFAKLKDSGNSDTLKHQALTVQMASQPAWYAVMALPYLMEFPHECSEQTFNRLYANALARHIANSDPKIRRVFDQWRNTPALDSPLEKNQDLKAVLLDETPWVRQAAAESQARRNVGVLFDPSRLDEETRRLTAKLAQVQNPDGGWPWFPGGRSNEFITLYIATGYGRLRHLGVQDVDVKPAARAVQRLDAWADEHYRRIADKDKNHLSPHVCMYLYGRSFFLKDVPVAQQHQEAVAYWQGQAKTYWLQVANRQSQAHAALALQRFGDKETPAAIVKSIRERSVSNEELGMFWRELELSWWWFRAPIETQAMMIELFAEVADDAAAVEECKVWLLKQKQTQDWKTTKATADAVYGLLLRGENLLKSDALVEVTLGGQTVRPEKVEAGTGFYEQKFVRGEVKPEMGAITLKKTDPGVAWGGVHWQYLEDVRKVTPHEGTPLKLEKSVFKRVYTKTGPVLEAAAGPLAVGDELVTRVVLRTDRDMEYVHLKDHRGSGTEPVNVLSRYRYQDGLAYYESTKDTASHFFIDYLPKGTYVFEYAVRVQHRGTYPTGLASIQCMYAPEFNSHSGSVTLEVK